MKDEWIEFHTTDRGSVTLISREGSPIQVGNKDIKVYVRCGSKVVNFFPE